MSTYTDLHNRVQESINVDYRSRETTQEVKLLNEHNEYWGTFKGTMQVDGIDINGGTLSGVKLKDVEISGATFKNVEGLNIDLDDYVSETEFFPYKEQITQAVNNANTARTEVTSLSSELKGDINRIDGLINNSSQTTQLLVDAGLSGFRETVNSKIDTISDSIIPGVSGQLTNIVEGLRLQLDNKDFLSDRQNSETALSNELTNLISETSAEVTGIISSVSSTISTDLTTAVDQLTTAINTTSSYLSGKIDSVSGEVRDERTQRINQDDALLGKINSVYNSDDRTGTVVDVSADLYRQLTVEGGIRARDDDYLSSELTNLCSLHRAEVLNRIYADAQLCNAISTLCADSQAADALIIESLNLTSTALDTKIDKTSADVLAELEYKRHYILNSGTGGHSPADVYPLVAKDMAVNIFDMDVPDAKVVYTKGDKCVDIARINVVGNELKVKTYAALSTKDEGVSQALPDNRTYFFSKTATLNEGQNGYTFEYFPPANSDDLLSAGNLFKLHATQLCYYNLILSGTLSIIGKVYALSCDSGTVLSGKYDIEVPESSELEQFRRFKSVSFDLNENLSAEREAQRITYQTDETFKLELGVHSIPFFDVFDEDHSELICRVYKTAGNEDGIRFDENSSITAIRLNDIESDSSRYAYLNTNNNFTTIISSYVHSGNHRVYNRYIDASIDGNLILFRKYDAARLNKYPFEFTSFDGEHDEQMTGYVVPILYNKTINEAVEQGRSFALAEVDLTDVVTIDRLKRKYTLDKVLGRDIWSTHYTQDGASIDVVYSNFSILSVHYTLNDPEIVDGVQQQNDFTHVLNVSREPIPDDYSADEEAMINLLSDTIDLDNTFVNENYELRADDIRDYVDKTYYMSFDKYDLKQTSLTPYDLDVMIEGMDDVDILLPTKLNYDPNYLVSREFLLVLRFKSNVDKNINVRLLKADGTKATFYNNKLQKITLPTNQWTTLQINEVQEGKYLVTDLNLNEDRLRFRELATISADHENRISTLEGTVDNHDVAINALSDATHFKGDVVLKTNYNDPNAVEEDEHTHLSMLVGTCNRIDPEQILERGYVFRCVLEDGADPLETYGFKESRDGDVLSLNNNDYIMLTEDGKLSDVNISNVVVVKDYSSHITNLSTASDDKYFINAEDNTATGTNTFEGSTLASALTAAELSAANVVANELKIETAISVGENIVANTTGLTASNLSAENLTADSFIASNLTASGITAGSAYLSDQLSTVALTATSAEISVQIVDNVVSVANSVVADSTGLTANNLSTGNLTANNLTAGIIDASEKVVVAENLSVDENGLSAKNFVATVAGISASSLSAPNLKIESVVADSTGLSANAISTTTLSASGSIIVDGKLTATDDGLTANGKLSTNNDLDVAGNLSVGSSMLSAKGISANADGLSTGTLEANAISVAAWSNVSAVVENLTTTLNDELTAIKSNVSTISGVVDGALSGNCVLPEHAHEIDTTHYDHLTATVSKLIIIDEATYDKYALTIRNGALNIDKIGHYDGN